MRFSIFIVSAFLLAVGSANEGEQLTPEQRERLALLEQRGGNYVEGDRDLKGSPGPRTFSWKKKEDN